MTIFDTMDSNVNSYTKTDLEIYEKVKKFPDTFADDSLQQIVNLLSISQSALSRFVKKNGFDSFSQFQYQLKQDIEEKKKEQGVTSRSAFYGQFLEQVENAIHPEQLDRIARKIMSASITEIAGVNLSSLPARYLDITCRIGRYALSEYYDPLYGAYPFDSSVVYMLFSAYSGKPQLQLLQHMSKMENPPYRVLVTLTPKHPLRKYFDETVVLPESKTNDFGHTVMTETFAFLLFTDLLSLKLDELRNVA